MARGDDFMLTAEELRQKRARRRRWIAAAVVVLVLMVVGVLAARPVRDAIKGWQARRHAEKAFALIDQQNWTEARTEAVAAFHLRSSEPQALRSVARFLSRTGQPQALEFWDKLRAESQLTHDDLRDEATIALGIGENARAESAIRELSKNSMTAKDRILAAQLALRQARGSDAQSQIDAAFNDPAASEQEQLQAALLKLASTRGVAGGEEQQERAWSRVRKLSEGKTDTALDALTVLAQQALGNAQQNTEAGASGINQLVAALQGHPLAKAQHKLLAIDLMMQADASHRDALLTRAVQEWKNAEASELAALATWLNGKGEFQRHLDAIPVERALQSRELFLQHVDALGALGRWEEIRALLESERFPLDPVITRMYLARCNVQLGQQTAAENNWNRALEAAHGDVNKLMLLADYAEKNGALETADAAFTRVIAAAPQVRAAHQGRLRVAQASKDTKRMHAVLAGMLQQWPNDPAVQNDEAYTRLLLSADASGDAPQIEQLAQALQERDPTSLPHRTLLALARLKQNRAADALRVYDNVQVQAQALTPSAIAVHSAVLAANGHGEDAASEAAQIPLENLLPEERALIEPLRAAPSAVQ